MRHATHAVLGSPGPVIEPGVCISAAGTGSRTSAASNPSASAQNSPACQARVTWPQPSVKKGPGSSRVKGQCYFTGIPQLGSKHGILALAKYGAALARHDAAWRGMARHVEGGVQRVHFEELLYRVGIRGGAPSGRREGRLPEY